MTGKPGLNFKTITSMKPSRLLWMPGLIALMLFLGAGPTAAQPGGRPSYRIFYEELEPYGRWMLHERYGRVWVPDVEPDFQPYATNGHWVITPYGHTWVSDYSWGWAPFHYGRWFYDRFWGWTWVPGFEWGPAWVCWRRGEGYYGWAPLAPGMSLYRYDIPTQYWCFVPQAYIVRPRVIRYCVPRTQVGLIYRNTRFLDNIHRYQNQEYVYGPRRDEVERLTRQRIDVYDIDQHPRPGRTRIENRSLKIYRPALIHPDIDRQQSRGLADRDRYEPVPTRKAPDADAGWFDRSADRNDNTPPVERRRLQERFPSPGPTENRQQRMPEHPDRQQGPSVRRDRSNPEAFPAGPKQELPQGRFLEHSRISRGEFYSPADAAGQVNQEPRIESRGRTSRETMVPAQAPLNSETEAERPRNFRGGFSPPSGPANKLSQPPAEQSRSRARQDATMPAQPFLQQQRRDTRDAELRTRNLPAPDRGLQPMRGRSQEFSRPGRDRGRQE